MKRKTDKSVIICGLVCLTLIEIVALFNGINGTLLTAVVGMIALAIGVAVPSPIK